MAGLASGCFFANDYAYMFQCLVLPVQCSALFGSSWFYKCLVLSVPVPVSGFVSANFCQCIVLPIGIVYGFASGWY